MAVLVSRMVPEDRAAAAAVALASSVVVDVDAELDRAWALVWVARESSGTDPTAFLVAWAVADELHLLHIATHPDARRRGAGGALLTAMIEHAQARKSRLVLLEVRRSNRAAIRLYRAFGFAAIGVRRQYYPEGEDAIEMMLTLDPETSAVTPIRDEVQISEAP